MGRYIEVLIVYLSFIAASHAKTEAEIKAWFMELGVECIKEHPVKPEELLMMQQHKIPESEDAKCMLACVYRKATWLDSEGKFSLENANTMMEKEYSDNPNKLEGSKKLFDECNKVNDKPVNDGAEGCERSALLSGCLIEQSPKFGFELPM